MHLRRFHKTKHKIMMLKILQRNLLNTLSFDFYFFIINE